MAVGEEHMMKAALAGVIAGSVLLTAGAQPALAQQQQKQKQRQAEFAAFGKPVTPAALDRERGGKNTVINKMQVDGSVHDNSAINTVSGSNFISDSAFSHASGLPVAIQNSGNNVSIQNAYIVNIHTDMQ